MKRDLLVGALHLLYDLGISTLVWVVLVPIELARLAVGRSRSGELGERLGRSLPLRSTAQTRWLVHAVSAGEVAAAGALIAALREMSTPASFVLTTGNALGRQAAEKLQRRLPEIEAVCYLPWDRRGAMRRWLALLAPNAVVVVETEIWPGFFRSCRELDVPLFVVNGRLYQKDVARYRLARRFFADALAAARWIGVLDDTEREAFVRIGAPADRTEVVGNLKFDVGARPGDVPEEWRLALTRPEHLPLIVAGSTHRPEERWLLEALLRLRQDFPGVRLALAPRHTSRGARLRELAASRGFRAVLWSRREHAASKWDVLVVDEVGPLAALFCYADIAFVGGSLARRGGHNPLEAAAQARPIVMGASIAHFERLVRGLHEAGGLTLLSSHGDERESLYRELARLLADPQARTAMGQRAFAFWSARRGVAQRYARELLDRLATPARHGSVLPNRADPDS